MRNGDAMPRAGLRSAGSAVGSAAGTLATLGVILLLIAALVAGALVVHELVGYCWTLLF
jgi:hypothetical protein